MLLFSRVFRLLAGIAVAALIYWAVRDIRLLDCSSLQIWMQGLGIFAPLIFCLVYCLATLGFFPGLLLTLSAGMIFGLGLGTFLVLTSSVLGATIMFIVARHFARAAVEKRFQHKAWFKRFNEEIQENSVRYMIFVRLIPIFPYNGVNLASGLTTIRLQDYVLGSVIGMLPGTLATVFIGETGCILVDPLSRGELGLSSIPFDVLLTQGAVVLLLATVAVAPIVIRRWKKKRSQK